MENTDPALSIPYQVCLQLKDYGVVPVTKQGRITVHGTVWEFHKAGDQIKYHPQGMTNAARTCPMHSMDNLVKGFVQLVLLPISWKDMAAEETRLGFGAELSTRVDSSRSCWYFTVTSPEGTILHQREELATVKENIIEGELAEPYIRKVFKAMAEGLKLREDGLVDLQTYLAQHGMTSSLERSDCRLAVGYCRVQVGDQGYRLQTFENASSTEPAFEQVAKLWALLVNKTPSDIHALVHPMRTDQKPQDDSRGLITALQLV